MHKVCKYKINMVTSSLTRFFLGWARVSIVEMILNSNLTYLS